MSSKSAMVLGYWDIRGLAHAIRMLLEYTDTCYEEKRYTCGEGNFCGCQWPSALGQGGSPNVFHPERNTTPSSSYGSPAPVSWELCQEKLIRGVSSCCPSPF
ncbi:Gstm5 [Phodopus roborovskii]|uniref:Gstm5 protein n=1 Tax=Phodopus roborovskii TaxID=109678 RepID=A0AAU9YY32_PHORO|nr:Gstm5 [Phodopus roborovskii]